MNQENNGILSKEVPWHLTTPGGSMPRPGNAREFTTGDWRSLKPVWIIEKCTQCMLCVPVCPDVAIPVNAAGKRTDYDYGHCKGCGICWKVCPFDAIAFGPEELQREKEDLSCR
jgi:pyruvate ferredoxin oxidoreductase delta subunit